MKIFSILILLNLIIHSRLCGQTEYSFYSFSDDISTEIARDTVPWKYQLGAAKYSFIGNHAMALSAWDLAMKVRNYQPSALDSVLLKNFTPQNAVDYIIHRSAKEQIIILNEAHHNTQHRTFTRSLLKGLYQNGYRYLGLEAISDSAINERKFAILKSGYYTKEPEFGNLISEAKKLGMVIFGYEASEGKNGKEREIEQAKNIQLFMKSNPPGKYIIHCGFDHVYENAVQNWEKAMAGRLKEYSGIDPFTIDQVRFSEKSKSEYSHLFLYATNEQTPFVFLDQANNVFNGISMPKQTDIMVIHPITKYIQGRPNWLSMDKVEYRIPDTRLLIKEYPIQVLAFREYEYEQNGIPADIIEINSSKNIKPLYLKEGSYTILIRNKEYNIIHRYTVSVTK